MLQSNFDYCRGIRFSHWLVPCLLSILLGFPTDTNLRSRAEDFPEKLGAEDISIEEQVYYDGHTRNTKRN